MARPRSETSLAINDGTVAMRDVQVLNERGDELNLTSLWRDRRILLVFLRHFGCRFCRQQVTMLMNVQSVLREHKVEIVLVSLGTSDQIGRFKAEFGFDGEVYVDPNPDKPLVYTAFQLRRGMEFVVGHPEGATKGEAALAAGFVDGGYPTPAGFQDFVGDGKYTGDVFQVGGVFVLGAGNTCDYAYRSSYAGDHPDPAAILEAVTGQRVDGSEFTFSATESWVSTLASDKRAPDPAAATVSPMIIGALLAAATALVLARWPVLAATAVAAAFAFRFGPPMPRLRSRSASGLQTCSGEVPAASEVPLLTPTQIDELTLKRNLVQCDCSRVTTGTDLETDWRVVHESSADGYQAAVSEVEALTSLDALGALGSSDAAASSDGRRRSLSMAGPVLPCAGRAENDAALHQMRLTTCYLREFLSKPHPLLGRAGPTCPFVPKALKLDAMRIGVVPTGAAPTADEMVRIVRGFLSIYEELTPQSGPTAVFKALVLLFPHIPVASAPELIDGTQAALKEEFVARGLMLGEFHLLNNAPGLHNPGFFPLRTVCPALAIRHMVPSDLVFLSGDKYPPQRRAAFLQSYIDKMSGQKGMKAQADVVTAQEQLNALLSEMKANPAAGAA